MARAGKDKSKPAEHSAHDSGSGFRRMFSDVANFIARAVGRPLAFSLAALTVVVWAATGPVFGYSDTWQLVINTGTTIVTFLMVFLIQNSQNRDNAAIQVKLDELIRVSKVKNVFVGIEHLTDEEIDELREKCETRARIGADVVVKTIGRKAQKAADAAG
jgi:low affinity Fe/Cu permease